MSLFLVQMAECHGVKGLRPFEVSLTSSSDLIIDPSLDQQPHSISSD
jgi:hypothetical protein